MDAKSAFEINLSNVSNSKILDLDLEDIAFKEEYEKVIDNKDIPEEDDIDNEIGEFDGFLNAEIGLKREGGEEVAHAKVIKRAKDKNGNPIGTKHESGNPLLDTRRYIVELYDGTREEISANILAENIMSQVDEEGHRQLYLDEICDHRKTSKAIPKSQATFITNRGLKRRTRTTKGWELCCKWKDGHSTWVKLKDLKESYPIEIMEYVKRKN